MSNSPYGTYEPQETLVTLETYEPPPGPPPHADTYRPGYESMETQPAWPVPGALLPPPSAPAADPAPQTAGRAEARRAARRRKRPERPDTLRRLLPQALVVAFLAAWHHRLRRRRQGGPAQCRRQAAHLAHLRGRRQ